MVSLSVFSMRETRTDTHTTREGRKIFHREWREGGGGQNYMQYAGGRGGAE